jgi:ubiquinone/menaquinone biosynthesis C-methylase UbiE
MDHNDHVNLLRPAKLSEGGTWADLGAGSGAFTLALRELIGNDAVIYAVDKDRRALNQLESAHRARFGQSGPSSKLRMNLIPLNQDFSRLSDIPPLDGVVMANSLHFFKDKERVLQHVRGLLKPNGTLLLVEYNADSGNIWVPHPLSFETYQTLAPHTGFSEPCLLAIFPSQFLREFYSAVCYRI